MRFISNHQMFVGIQDRFDHRDRLFVRHLTEIVNPQTFLVGQVDGYWLTLSIQDTAAGDPVKPLLAADSAEMLAQAVKHRLPPPWRQVERAGLTVCSRKR